MKTFTLSLLALALGVAPMKAQIFQPNVVNGALLGGIAGAIIGNNSGHYTARGALIGAVGGAVLGSLVQPQSAAVYTQQPAPVIYAQSAPVVYSTQPAQVTAFAYDPAPIYCGYGYGYRPYYHGWPYCYAPRFRVTFNFRSGGRSFHRW
jgi:hypothetical protein